MTTSIIQERLLSYQCQNIIEQENALKEIAQEIALMALSKAGFFDVAAFQGGTCLRIVYGLNRFSEDLDFVLEKPNNHFDWEKYLNNLTLEFNAYGFELEISERKKTDKAVQSRFLKAHSLGGLLILKDPRSHIPKLRIKLEIDTNPPEGSEYELKYLDFPIPFSIKTQTLPSLFAGKCHALLSRNYVKGRDWYDFTWYTSRKAGLNLALLYQALLQSEPEKWANIKHSVIKNHIFSALEKKIRTIDWESAKQDVAPFLRKSELETLKIWSQGYFLSCLEKLKNTL